MASAAAVAPAPTIDASWFWRMMLALGAAPPIDGSKPRKVFQVDSVADPSCAEYTLIGALLPPTWSQFVMAPAVPEASKMACSWAWLRLATFAEGVAVPFTLVKWNQLMPSSA